MAVAEFGKVDILCNNAAAPGADCYVWEQTLENWNATIAIDVTAAMLCTREALKQSMLEQRSGVILNFSSTVGLAGIARKTHYVTAKASLRAFTKTVALEVGPYGIRCNCIVPAGSTPTSGNPGHAARPVPRGTSITNDRGQAPVRKRVAYISAPDDVANLALFLAKSDDSRTITGQSIVVDAGGHMLG